MLVNGAPWMKRTQASAARLLCMVVFFILFFSFRPEEEEEETTLLGKHLLRGRGLGRRDSWAPVKAYLRVLCWRSTFRPLTVQGSHHQLDGLEL